jgi:crotonobetainyl-CoA:carnitine CoA-transferase CaiB-like acyl-CoA transferase
MRKINVKQIVSKPYRVLDLTEGGCMLGGRMLGDIGADVIKIEPPTGSISRIAPFYKNIPHPEKSLFWYCYNTNKRGITLDIALPEGQELLRRLVQTADIVMESFLPGYLDGLNLGYQELVKIKPDIILASITPFGQSGPKSSFQGSDLTAWASGGYLYICGEQGSPPVWISFPQASLFGGAEAAIGAMTAIWYRHQTGEGQHVDVSLQECSSSPTLNVLQMWGANKVEFHRIGGCLYVPSTGVKQPIYFKCRDGYIMIMVQGGNEPFVSSSKRLVNWMAEEKMAPDWLIYLNWVTDYNGPTMKQEIADRVGAAIEKFTLTKTKSELYEEGAIKRQILAAPVFNTQDISEDTQLEARKYWQKVWHPELNEELIYCGPPVRMIETPMDCRLRSPLIGEHNREIYCGELGIPEKELKGLKDEGVV